MAQFLNALGDVFKEGMGGILSAAAPEAYAMGQQRKHQNALASALKGGDFAAASDAAFDAGNIDGGLKLMQHSQGQQDAARQQQVQGTLSLFQSMDVPQISTMALETPQEFERITGMTGEEYMQLGNRMQQSGMSPDEFRQFVIQKAQAELGQAPDKPEAYTLAPGARRYQGGELVAENPAGGGETWEDIQPPAGAPAGVYQRNTVTGAIKRVAAPPSAGVTVNTGDVGAGQRPIVDKPGKGYQRIFDPESNTYRDIPIPGGEVAQERESAATKAFGAYQANEEQFTTMIDNIDEVISAVSPLTAGIGSITAGIPGTPARDMEARLETVRANIGFDKLNEMRQTSPTGGALGQVTERELKFLQSVRGSLDMDQSPAQLRETLGEIKASLERLQEVRRIAYQLEYGAVGDGQSRPRIGPDEPAADGDLPPGFRIIE